MNLGSWIVLGIVVLAVALAIRSIVRDRKNGKSCSCGCSGCSGGTKPESCSAADNMVRRMEENARS